VPIPTKVVSSNLAHGKVYSIHPCVIMLVSEMRQLGGFLRFPSMFSPIKLTTTRYCWNNNPQYIRFPVKATPGQIVQSQIGPKSKRPQNESQIGHILSNWIKNYVLIWIIINILVNRFMYNFIFLLMDRSIFMDERN
jgi:hypothetical protein